MVMFTGAPVNQQAYRMEQGQVWRQYIIAGVANLVIVSCGYAAGWSSPVLVKLQNETLSPLPGPLVGDQGAWIGSLFSAGALIGPFIAGFLASRIGRKWALMASSVPLFIGWILIAAATSVGFIYAGRIVWGASVGMLFAVGPMYCAEIATDDSRGALGSYLQVSLSLGYLLVYSIGPYISYSAIAYFGVAFVGVFVIAFFFMPESPYYHLLKSNNEAAANALMTLRGKSRGGIENELLQMEEDMKASMTKTATIADVFRGSNFKAFYISSGLLFFQQFSGINAVLCYMTLIFDAAGSDLDSAIESIIVGVVQVVASLMTPFVVDRLGRKILLLVSTCGTSISLGLLGMYFILDANNSPVVESLSFLPILCLILYMFTYCWGLGSLPWVLLSELFPMEVKAIAAPIVATFCCTLAFFITRYFEPIADAVGMQWSFWIFSVCCALAFFFTLFFVPETKGKSFAEIQDMLAGRPQHREKPEKA